MQKKTSLLCICLLSICLCACQKTDIVSETVLEPKENEQNVSRENQDEQQEIEQSILEEDNLIESDTNEEENETVYNRVLEDGETFLDGYHSLILDKGVKRAELIYLDEDDIPELLVLKNGEYRLYSCDDTQITAIDMPDAEIKANAYGFHLLLV